MYHPLDIYMWNQFICVIKVAHVTVITTAVENLRMSPARVESSAWIRIFSSILLYGIME